MLQIEMGYKNPNVISWRRGLIILYCIFCRKCNRKWHTINLLPANPAVQQSSRSNHFQNKEEAFVVGTKITFLHLFWIYCLFAFTATYLVCQSTCCGSKNGAKQILKLHFNFLIIVHNGFFTFIVLNYRLTYQILKHNRSYIDW